METQGFSHVITDRGGWSYKGLTDSLRIQWRHEV